jgi:hypothetical protein
MFWNGNTAIDGLSGGGDNARNGHWHRFYTVRPDRLGNILDGLVAEIGKRYRQLVADVIAYHRRDADRAGLGERLQASGNVDPVAEQVGAVDHNVADMHADAEAHRLVPSAAGAFGCDSVLRRHRARDGVNRAGEIGDHAVARRVEDPAAVGCDQPVDDGPTGLESGKRADFVLRHQPAVAGNVGREDR